MQCSLNEGLRVACEAWQKSRDWKQTPCTVYWDPQYIAERWIAIISCVYTYMEVYMNSNHAGTHSHIQTQRERERGAYTRPYVALFAYIPKPIL